jgi:DNA mismatch endonuclease (patch repair protein)
MAYRLGFRYRLHGPKLPGRPDIVFPARRSVVFVHGCFWHGHGCAKGKLPKSRLSYWSPKIVANRDRDARNLADLRRAGWRCLVIWQCELKKIERAERKLIRFLGVKSKSIKKKGAGKNGRER